jgi:hypothetical protein
MFTLENIRDWTTDPYDPKLTVIENWPVGFPFIVKTPAGTVSSSTSLQENDFGKIQSLPNKAGLIYVTRSRGLAKVTAHIDNIKAGYVNKYGDVRLIVNEPNMSKPTAVLDTSRNSLFFRALKALIDELAFKADVIGMSDDHLDTSSKRQQLANDIYRGVREIGSGNLLAVFDRPNFTRADVIAHATPTSSSQKGLGCIYLRDHSNFVGAPDCSPIILFGSTVDNAHRDTQYAADIKSANPRAAQFKMAKKARRVGGYVVCRVKDASTTTKLKLIEQIFILLFESQRPGIIGAANRLLNQIAGTGPGADEDASHDRWTDDIRVAKMLREVADAAKQVSGWPGACLRADFGALGFNWNSPVLESGMGKSIWTTYRTSDGTQHFTRAACRLGSANWLFTVGLQRFGFDLFESTVRKLGVRPNSKSVVKPQVGDLLHVTFEIAPKGREHPRPYLMLANRIPWSDRSELVRLGVRVEWFHTGTWVSIYEQRPRRVRLLDNNNPSSWIDMAVVRAFLRFFSTTSYANPPAWQYDFGTPRLYRLTMDQRRQERTLTPVSPSTAQLSFPTLTTVRAFGQAFQAAGAENVGGKYGEFGPRLANGQFQTYQWTSQIDANWTNVFKNKSARAINSLKGAAKTTPFDFEGTIGQWVPSPTAVIMKQSPSIDLRAVCGVFRTRSSKCDRCWVMTWPV